MTIGARDATAPSTRGGGISPAQAALAYAGLGWTVIPVWAPVDGVCGCGRADCPSAGKHPRVRWQSYMDHPPASEQVAAWWRRWPKASVAVVTGASSGVAVVDVDGAAGEVALRALQERIGPLPASVEARTGNGRHLWFALRRRNAVASTVLGPGLELKAEGATVVAPPSRHASGRRYAWMPGCAPWERAPADLPPVLAAPGAGSGHSPTAGARGEVPARTASEQAEFAEAWGRAGITLAPGDNYYRCPFHDDHRPSLHVDAEGCRWYCFGCRRGGGIVALRRELGEEPDGGARRRVTGQLASHLPITLGGGEERPVVGESRHQGALLRLAGGRRAYGGVEIAAVAELAPEPDNPVDPEAIAVTVDGDRVGYLRRQDARALRPAIDDACARHGVATCPARIRGGWDRGRGDVGAFGVVLELPSRPGGRRGDLGEPAP